MTDYPIRAEVAYWDGYELRRLAALRKEARGQDYSLYVHIESAGNEVIHSFHASGRKNLKFRDADGEALKRRGFRDFGDGKEIPIVWDLQEGGEGRFAEDDLFLKTDRLDGYPKCENRPEIVFSFPTLPSSLGLSFYPQTAYVRRVPMPNREMSFGCFMEVLPPVFVLANSGGLVNLITAKERRYEGDVWNDIPRPAFCLLDGENYLPVVCHPGVGKDTGFMINILNKEFYPSPELVKAASELAPR